jgi:DNA-binding GntR family transcriptional regulator
MFEPSDLTKKSENHSFSFRPEGLMLSLPEQIADRICNAILAGEIHPGERIQESPVATAFQVSRGPVREALRLLEYEGLVTFSPRRGATVTMLSIDEVEQLFDIRAALSSLAAQQAAKNINPKLLKQAHEIISTMLNGAEAEMSLTDYIALSSQAGQIVAAASGNTRLENMIQSLSRQTLRYAQLGLSTPERRLQSSKRWLKLLKAIETGDSKTAGEINTETILLSKNAAILHLKQQVD